MQKHVHLCRRIKEDISKLFGSNFLETMHSDDVIHACVHVGELSVLMDHY